ncbi:UbiA-like protein EboC [Aquiflexum gelatinilyticum]|uniref:UbiA-like protein EboC n=1 Tax=Aquiflexum gelatinilyticum TaxID=2961943 RepID=A0A9X2P481_9BACT|nr:UbiA-like protein EboC [Aquiflexum gelatinilyticum]MCR9016014.1 UbiA-like protein EboC [Aquiflexum gelatinilyticum]
MSKIKAYLQLTRPANIVTAIADIWAGFAVAGGALVIFADQTRLIDSPVFHNLLWLTLSTIGLYGGGVAFNDVFDAELDAKERPERPIPSGRVSKGKAALMAFLLLLIGIIAAWNVSTLSALIALTVAVLAVLYDYWGKHQFIFGPINMGLCRAGNLLLGISAFPVMLQSYWYLGFIPLIFVAAITMISRGEVHGKNRRALKGGFLMYIFIILSIAALSILEGNRFFHVIPFIALFAYMIFPPLIKAMREQIPQLIGKAVKAGVISLIILNASLAAAFSGWQFGIIVLLLLPISIYLAKKFAVT